MARPTAEPPEAAIDPPVASTGLTARLGALPGLLTNQMEYTEVFAPTFQAAVTLQRWQALLAEIAAMSGGAIEVAHVDVTSPWSANVHVRFERTRRRMRIAVDAMPPHRINSFFVGGPVADETSLPAILDAIRALPGNTGLAVARLSADAPALQQQFASDWELSIGSEFKLVILVAVIHAITAGERHWDDPVTISGQPLAGGRYAALPVGTDIPFREMVGAMISVSDNSATDIIIATLGRPQIEAMLSHVGMARPEGMRPFLTTLEAFKLKAMIAAGDVRWLRADEAQRRELLAGAVAAMPLGGIDKAFASGKPMSIETVEWRASPMDVIRILDWIRRHTESGPAAEARTILARNPGIGTETAAGWRYVGYKGGSEPGVIAMSLLLQRQSGAWLAVSAAWNDATDPVDEGRFFSLIDRLVELLRDDQELL